MSFHRNSELEKSLHTPSKAWVWESETWVLVLVLLLPGCLAIFSAVEWGCSKKRQIRLMVHTQKMEGSSRHNLSLRLPK